MWKIFDIFDTSKPSIWFWNILFVFTWLIVFCVSVEFFIVLSVVLSLVGFVMLLRLFIEIDTNYDDPDDDPDRDVIITKSTKHLWILLMPITWILFISLFVTGGVVFIYDKGIKPLNKWIDNKLSK